MLSSWLCCLDSEINLCFGKWIAWELMGSGQMTSLSCANMSKVSNDIRSRTSPPTTCAKPALMIRGRRWSTFSNCYPPTSSTSPMAYHLVLSEIYVSTLVTFFFRLPKYPGAAAQRTEEQFHHAQSCLWGSCCVFGLCLHSSYIIRCWTNAGKKVFLNNNDEDYFESRQSLAQSEPLF